DRTDCGNGIVEGSEQCDDGNNDGGDGCSVFCQIEPTCPQNGGPCTSECGDGILLPDEIAAGHECDDGNNIDGDGCSADCKFEPGWVCELKEDDSSVLILPLVLRDFWGWNDSPNTRGEYAHPDFYRENPGLTTGMVKSTLDSDGLPEWSGMSTQTIADSRTQFQPGGNYAPPAEWTWFKMWYRDHPVFNRTIIDNITLTELPNGA